MASNAESFEKFRRSVDLFFENEARESIIAATQKIALDALTRVVLRTPVDTGRARGNWQVGLGPQIPSDILEQADKSGQKAISSGESKISRLDTIEAVTIANNVEYILFLESGSSSQAPGGMVGITFAEIETQFARIIDAEL